MSCSVEIIDFSRPDSSRKNLFITNIPGTLSEEEVVVKLHEIFEPYGMLYGVQVYQSQQQWKLKKDADTDAPEAGYYAFVTFYSSMVATRAKEDLNSVLLLNDQECKITFAKRKKDSTDKVSLYFSRCYQLLNTYLGFNSWSTAIKTIFEDTDSHTEVGQTMCIKYVCLVTLTIQDLHTDGVGVWQETFIKTDPLSKIQITCKCKKLCHMRAIENAFSKVLLVVLGNGKVMVEIDTTKPDYHANVKPQEQLVKVNELDDKPKSEQQDDDTDDVPDNISAMSGSHIDDINLHILQELEDEMG